MIWACRPFITSFRPHRPSRQVSASSDLIFRFLKVVIDSPNLIFVVFGETQNQTVVFNGISISLADLKREIMEKEGLKSTEVDLSISNAQNSEIYKNEQEMISKNSSVIIQRTPLRAV